MRIAHGGGSERPGRSRSIPTSPLGFPHDLRYPQRVTDTADRIAPTAPTAPTAPPTAPGDPNSPAAAPGAAAPAASGGPTAAGVPSAPTDADAGPTSPPLFDAERRATELAILDALRAVVDPEIGMNVVELALIKQILLGPNETEIKMILTTPFCPYAGSMIQQVTEQAESVVDHPVKVTLLAERWDPRDAGLMW